MRDGDEGKHKGVVPRIGIDCDDIAVSHLLPAASVYRPQNNKHALHYLFLLESNKEMKFSEK